jgi:hypothetical protein
METKEIVSVGYDDLFACGLFAGRFDVFFLEVKERERLGVLIKAPPTRTAPGFFHLLRKSTLPGRQEEQRERKKREDHPRYSAR